MGLKAVKNKNQYLTAVARSSLLEADGWYNSVYDNKYATAVELWRKISYIFHIIVAIMCITKNNTHGVCVCMHYSK